MHWPRLTVRSIVPWHSLCQPCTAQLHAGVKLQLFSVTPCTLRTCRARAQLCLLPSSLCTDVLHCACVARPFSCLVPWHVYARACTHLTALMAARLMMRPVILPRHCSSFWRRITVRCSRVSGEWLPSASHAFAHTMIIRSRVLSGILLPVVCCVLLPWICPGLHGG